VLTTFQCRPHWLLLGPAWISDLERAKDAAAAVAAAAQPGRWSTDRHELNPTLHLLQLNWRNLGPYATMPDPPAGDSPPPVPGAEMLLLWRSPWNGRVLARAAGPDDLLALKIVAEDVHPKAAAALGPLSIGAIENVLSGAADAGILWLSVRVFRREEILVRWK